MSDIVYKCRWGMFCHNESCFYIHPWQHGYYRAPYYQSTVVCRYETDETACRLKCGSKQGRYCPFLHCNHEHRAHLTITCTNLDCQRHCPDCF